MTEGDRPLERLQATLREAVSTLPSYVTFRVTRKSTSSLFGSSPTLYQCGESRLSSEEADDVEFAFDLSCLFLFFRRHQAALDITTTVGELRNLFTEESDLPAAIKVKNLAAALDLGDLCNLDVKPTSSPPDPSSAWIFALGDFLQLQALRRLLLKYSGPGDPNSRELLPMPTLNRTVQKRLAKLQSQIVADFASTSLYNEDSLLIEQMEKSPTANRAFHLDWISGAPNGKVVADIVSWLRPASSFSEAFFNKAFELCLATDMLDDDRSRLVNPVLNRYLGQWIGVVWAALCPLMTDDPVKETLLAGLPADLLNLRDADGVSDSLPFFIDKSEEADLMLLRESWTSGQVDLIRRLRSTIADKMFKPGEARFWGYLAGCLSLTAQAEEDVDILLAQAIQKMRVEYWLRESQKHEELDSSKAQWTRNDGKATSKWWLERHASFLDSVGFCSSSDSPAMMISRKLNDWREHEQWSTQSRVPECLKFVFRILKDICQTQKQRNKFDMLMSMTTFAADPGSDTMGSFIQCVLNIATAREEDCGFSRLGKLALLEMAVTAVQDCVGAQASSIPDRLLVVYVELVCQTRSELRTFSSDFGRRSYSDGSTGGLPDEAIDEESSKVWLSFLVAAIKNAETRDAQVRCLRDLYHFELSSMALRSTNTTGDALVFANTAQFLVETLVDDEALGPIVFEVIEALVACLAEEAWAIANLLQTNGLDYPRNISHEEILVTQETMIQAVHLIVLMGSYFRVNENSSAASCYYEVIAENLQCLKHRILRESDVVESTQVLEVGRRIVDNMLSMLLAHVNFLLLSIHTLELLYFERISQAPIMSDRPSSTVDIKGMWGSSVRRRRDPDSETGCRDSDSGSGIHHTERSFQSYVVWDFQDNNKSERVRKLKASTPLKPSDNSANLLKRSVWRKLAVPLLRAIQSYGISKCLSLLDDDGVGDLEGLKLLNLDLMEHQDYRLGSSNVHYASGSEKLSSILANMTCDLITGNRFSSESSADEFFCLSILSLRQFDSLAHSHEASRLVTKCGVALCSQGVSVREVEAKIKQAKEWMETSAKCRLQALGYPFCGEAEACSIATSGDLAKEARLRSRLEEKEPPLTIALHSILFPMNTYPEPEDLSKILLTRASELNPKQAPSSLCRRRPGESLLLVQALRATACGLLRCHMVFVMTRFSRVLAAGMADGDLAYGKSQDLLLAFDSVFESTVGRHYQP